MIYHPSEMGYKKLWSFVIPYRLISKSNEKARGKAGHVYTSSKFKAFEASIAWLSVSVCKRPMLKEGWVVIEPHFERRDNCDPTNLFKGILDALVKGGVFEDDRRVGGSVPPHPIIGDFNSVIEIWG